MKFYDPARSFGFVVPNSGARDVFVHSSVLWRSGLADLQSGQRVNACSSKPPGMAMPCLASSRSAPSRSS